MGENIRNIAIVGGGVAGLTAAHILQRKYAVTLFEKNDYIGGHTHTIVISDGPDAGIPVDTGFIVMNHRNYPIFTRLLEQLGVELRDSNMSFSYYDERTGLHYEGSGLNGLFAQRRNLLRPRFYRLVGEIMRFFREASADLAGGGLIDCTLGQYLEERDYSQDFIRHHVVPMGSAIWSTPCDRMMEFPAESFCSFFSNHGLLGLKDRPQWKTVNGGSHTYVKRILEGLGGEVRSSAPVSDVVRRDEGVELTLNGGETRRFDAAIIAAHADEALAMLRDPSTDEKRLLGAWKYECNHTVLHTDSTVMPPSKRAWASWNYRRERTAPPDGPATLSYHMNRLQGLAAQREYFVTLNRSERLPAERIIAEMDYDHPTYTRESFASQAELPGLNGRRRTYFCGSYFGYGFHEDAVRSAVKVAQSFGLDL